MDGKFNIDHARTLDREDCLKHMRDEFIIPTKGDVKRKTIATPGQH